MRTQVSSSLGLATSVRRNRGDGPRLTRLPFVRSDNVLQISVLNLFVQFKARFPNMVVGEITRKKMRNALEKGITADQVSKPLLSFVLSCSRSFLTPYAPFASSSARPDHQLPDRPCPSSDAQERTYVVGLLSHAGEGNDVLIFNDALRFVFVLRRTLFSR